MASERTTEANRDRGPEQPRGEFMATMPQSVSLKPRWARAPFYFNSASHLMRIGGKKAGNLQELLDVIKTCSDASIFQHTFQTLEEHHFILAGFSNDFSHWAFAACNEVELAERLAAIDIREFVSISALRERLVQVIESYLQRNPRAGTRMAMEPLYLMAADLVVVPTPFVARNLEEFAGCLRKVSVHSIYYHFIDARLRLKLNTNDFSVWLERDLELQTAARRLNQIDIYTSTLEDVRQSILATIDSEIVRH